MRGYEGDNTTTLERPEVEKDSAVQVFLVYEIIMALGI
jgi:hypothetical protein